MLVIGVLVAVQPAGMLLGLVLTATGFLGTLVGLGLQVQVMRHRAEALALGRAGHELRTPLAVMTAWLDQFREPAGEVPDPEVLDRQIRRMRVMVEGTLQGTRHLGRTRSPRVPSPCLRQGGPGWPLTRVFADLSRLWPGPEETFPDKPAGGIAIPRLRWVLPNLGTLAQVSGDDRFHHILANLLQNAFRHGIPRARPLTRPWEVSVEVVLVSATSLEVVVQDEGPGVRLHPLTRLPTSLDPETRRGPGTGLGFYLVRELVASAGGAISMGPRPGTGLVRRGTRVCITLPVEDLLP